MANEITKTDRRRKFNEGDPVKRLSISIPESMYNQIVEENPDINISLYIRKAIESYEQSK